MNKTDIEYLDYSWNVTHGCSPISEGCVHCWAKATSHRLAGMGVRGYSKENPFAVTCCPWKLDEPLKVKKPSRIGVSFMGDLFHEDVPWDFIDAVLAVIALKRKHQFLILTKRPERMLDHFKSIVYERLQESYGSVADRSMPIPIPDDWPIKNLWLGVTAENQEQADKRIPTLLQIPAAKRFVSLEPLLSKIDLTKYMVLNYNPVQKGDLDYGNYQEQRREGLSSGANGRDCNRQPGADLENRQTRLGSLAEKDGIEKMQKSKSGKRQRAIPNDSDDDKPKTVSHASEPPGLFSIQRQDSIEYDDKSQEREKERQSTKESGDNDTFSEHETHDLPTQKRESSKSVGDQKFNGKIDGRTGYRNPQPTKNGTFPITDRKEVSDKLSTCIRNSPKQSKTNNFWVIIGAESGANRRECKIEWVRNVVGQCQAAEIPTFVKQLHIDDRLSKDPSEWPEDLRVREYPC